MGLVSFSDTATVNSMLSPVVEQAARAAEGLTAGGKSNPGRGDPRSCEAAGYENAW